MREEIKNEFVFHPVGHGLFYSGSLLGDKYNFIYDCGGDKEHLEKALGNYTKSVSDKEIDFLVVSHLDKDHVCGVYSLQKKHGKKIKNIYLPYLYDKDTFKFAIAIILSTISESDEDEDFKDLSEIFRFWIDVFNDEDTEFIGEEEEIKEVPFPKDGSPYWIFKMFNKINKNNGTPIDIVNMNKEIKEYLNDKPIEDCSFDKKDCKEFREIYKKYCSSINASSIILIHYPVNECVIEENCENFEHKYKYYNSYGFPNCKLNLLGMTGKTLTHKCAAETILTGDAEFDNDMLKKVKDIVRDPEREDCIKIFQVPHHGSLKNWELMDDLKFEFDVYPVSFKCGDKHHPNHKVLFELVSAGKYIRSVSQFGKYSYEINCENHRSDEC